MNTNNNTLYDPFLLQGLRNKMADMLALKVTDDKQVIDSMRQVPRHLFIDLSLERIAYEERAIEILCSQTISQPSTVAFQTHLLDLKPRDKVLEIGTGSGYQTAVLYKITQRIYTMERQKDLYLQAQRTFAKVNIHPHCFYGDGYKGLSGFAPFDKILVTCGAPFVPQDLVKQLKIGGKMVIPVGDKSQTMLRITKISEKETKTEEFGSYKFVPMLEDKQK